MAASDSFPAATAAADLRTPGVADQECAAVEAGGAANAAGGAANAAGLEGQTDCSAADSAEGWQCQPAAHIKFKSP